MKLVLYAGCKDITFFRMGTCGGIGSKPGTIVITEEAVDGLFKPEFKQVNYFFNFFYSTIIICVNFVVLKFDSTVKDVH